ncbi:hypothetical protein BGZ83_012017 [Gryganskiella cystojenkinii]|nr:hypothetical protein BGZ83_012017 [Gryganskiella cystojenkinii]
MPQRVVGSVETLDIFMFTVRLLHVTLLSNIMTWRPIQRRKLVQSMAIAVFIEASLIVTGYTVAVDARNVNTAAGQVSPKEVGGGVIVVILVKVVTITVGIVGIVGATAVVV